MLTERLRFRFVVTMITLFILAGCRGAPMPGQSTPLVTGSAPPQPSGVDQKTPAIPPLAETPTPTPSGEAGATPTTIAVATPYADSPAAGICAEPEDPIVTVSLVQDLPSPRCMKVTPGQRLNIKNATAQSLQARLGSFEVTLAPNQEATFEADLGAYLAPGVHIIIVSGSASGPEIWLIQQLPDGVKLHPQIRFMD